MAKWQLFYQVFSLISFLIYITISQTYGIQTEPIFPPTNTHQIQMLTDLENFFVPFQQIKFVDISHTENSSIIMSTLEERLRLRGNIPIEKYNYHVKIKFHHQMNKINTSSQIMSTDESTRRRTLTTKRFLLHPSIYIFYISQETIKQTLEFLEKCAIFGQPHRDPAIFFGQKRSDLHYLFQQPIIKKFKYKLGVSGDSRDVYEQVKIFNKNDLNGMIVRHSSSPLKLNINDNLNGRELSVLAAPIPPYLTLGRDGSISGGSHHLALSTLGNRYNFTMSVDTSARGTGYFVNGTWNGITGGVYYEKYDIGQIAALTYPRYGVIDTVYAQQDGIHFFTKPPSYTVKWQALFYPYNIEAWMAIGVSSLAVVLTLYLQLGRANHGATKDRSFWAWCIPYQILLDQGFNLKIPTSVKILSSFWMFFTLIIATGYRCDLISYFSQPHFSKIPRNFEELSERTDYTILFNYFAGTAYQYFSSNRDTDELVKGIYSRFVKQPNPAQCIISSVLEEKTVCVAWHMIGLSMTFMNLTLPELSKPIVLVVSKPIVPYVDAIVFPKNSVYTDTFSQPIGRLRDAGLIVKWNEDVYYNFSVPAKSWLRTQRTSQTYKNLNLVMQQSQINQLRPLTVQMLVVVFYVVVIGCGVGFLLILAEIFQSQSKTQQDSIGRKTMSSQ